MTDEDTYTVQIEDGRLFKVEWYAGLSERRADNCQEHLRSKDDSAENAGFVEIV